MLVSIGLYLIPAMLCSASMAIVLRFFRSSDNNPYAMILGNYLTCSLTGFLLLKEKSLILRSQPVTYLCGLAGGCLFVLSLVCMQRSIRRSGAILTSAFSKLGLLVPLALSVLFLHEQPGIVQAGGLLLVILAIWLFSQSGNREIQTENIHLLSLLVVLLTNGAADAMAKVYNAFGVRSEDSVYIFFVFLSASVITTCLLLNETKRSGKKASLRDLAAGILVGLPNYFSSVLLLKALDAIPAFIAYPVFSSGAIITVTLFSLFFFHERLNRIQTAGLLLILVSLVLLNL